MLTVIREARTSRGFNLQEDQTDDRVNAKAPLIIDGEDDLKSRICVAQSVQRYYI